MSDSASNPQAQKLAFQVEPNDPMIVNVTRSDGKRYRISVRLAVIDVIDTGAYQAEHPTIPLFQFKAQLVADTQETSQ
ncbi:MAG: hypothetical protein U0326_09640 [Polyangiales bacterium]